jgi:hypothetical protein
VSTGVLLRINIVLDHAEDEYVVDSPEHTR